MGVYANDVHLGSKVIKGVKHAFSQNNSKIRCNFMDELYDLEIVKTHAKNSKEVRLGH